MNPSEHDSDTKTDRETVDCAALELATGAVVVYNPENHRAWLQSNTAVAPEDRR